MPEYKLPDVGEGLTEAEIVTWRVAVGDTIAVNDVIVEIETAKSIVELPSPYAGEVTALLVAEGDTVTVGTPIIAIGAAEAAAAAPAPAPEPAAASAGPPRAAAPIDTNVPPAGNPTLVGYGPKQRELRRRARVAVPVADAPVAEAPVATAASTRVLAKPPVRKLARDLGVDLAGIAGSGPEGRVTRDDVQAAASGVVPPAAASAASAAVPASVGERETREPIKGVRKQMATAMVGSAFTAPHVTEWVTVDATATVELVERLKARRDFAEVRVSPLLVAARATLLALRRHPLLNSTWDEAAQEVVLKHYVNLGIAADTPRGLVVPNVKDADALDLLGLARALEALTGTAREGRTQPAELAGGTFTITNVGVFGVDAGTPIINPGESAILCLGAIRPQPWVVGDQVVPRKVMTLAVSFDHRHIDGATGSRFLADVAGIIEDPATALLY
ncbi:2-oxo acid dehydrogenase subunit E2 [Nocardioides sp. GY 10113]|uniref:dihydrolipoamide acetyltransferase family protein n=1 Tax=Nocardioides sp. GY 10113 TaxID=2569761 RepID=UPI0010A7ECBE|nr:dihydrolipoamide acetyltransferase family protein [Nocardioides sp. GY 10113]TIC84978.1 2-oxo acid dehydrogenase subunit E2 [Nocardioides sp. GY 10113]